MALRFAVAASLLLALAVAAEEQISSDDIAVLRAAAFEWKRMASTGTVHVARTTDTKSSTLSTLMEAELATTGVGPEGIRQIVAQIRSRNEKSITLQSPALVKSVDVSDDPPNVAVGLPGYDEAKRYALVSFRIEGDPPRLMLLKREREGGVWEIVWRSDRASDGSWASPVAGSTGLLRVGGDVKPPIVIERVPPHYPGAAKEAGLQGVVIVEAIIDDAGNVTDARVLKPLPYGMNEAALEAVRQWKFRPATLEGRPLAVAFNLAINFKLDPQH